MEKALRRHHGMIVILLVFGYNIFSIKSMQGVPIWQRYIVKSAEAASYLQDTALCIHVKIAV